MSLSDRDIGIYAAIGFIIWLSGAVEFYYGGAYAFESGPAVAGLSAVVIAIAVCLIFRSTLRWRKTPEADAVTVAVTMGLPGLFGEAVRQVLFTQVTRLHASAQPVFAATLFFGNAALLAYALWVARQARH